MADQDNRPPIPQPRDLAAELVDRGDGWYVSPELLNAGPDDDRVNLKPVEMVEWCGKAEAHGPHGKCNGFGMHAGPGRLPVKAADLPKHVGPRRSSRTGAVRRQCFPPAD